ncbi:hypothetical protein BCR42DRAFT_395017 [Absidia repens]|uniref:Uncharacterized protein n=1 Tax=Absidia repens TaxID=90262 RepID=A0A1X2I9C5_9FUNG|nr:hypothetical protein BCR42DRAFT_395017 [Absidia repens]
MMVILLFTVTTTNSPTTSPVCNSSKFWNSHSDSQFLFNISKINDCLIFTAYHRHRPFNERPEYISAKWKNDQECTLSVVQKDDRLVVYYYLTFHKPLVLAYSCIIYELIFNGSV